MNNPSKENGDYVTLQCGGTIEVPVLINDFEPDGDSLTITIVSEPCNGDSLTLPTGMSVMKMISSRILRAMIRGAVTTLLSVFSSRIHLLPMMTLSQRYVKHQSTFQ